MGNRRIQLFEQFRERRLGEIAYSAPDGTQLLRHDYTYDPLGGSRHGLRPEAIWRRRKPMRLPTRATG